MSLKISSEALFIANLDSGINLFAGSGFSLLKNDKGKKLFDQFELKEALCKKFKFDNSNDYTLDELCELIVHENSVKEFNDFLRKVFTVNEYNPLYDNLLKIKIKSFITTNIDNLFQRIVAKSKYCTLNDVTYYGLAKESDNVIDFLPLHGSVTKESNLLFTKSQIASAGKTYEKYFDVFKCQIRKRATIFLGYGFKDSGIMNMLLPEMENNRSNIWIMCLPEDRKSIEYYERLGYNLVIGNTEEFLKWVNENIKGREINQDNIDKTFLNQYLIPSQTNNFEKISIENYYQRGICNWNNILNGHPAETHYLNEVRNLFLENRERTLIVTGISFSGKSTLAMQVALQMQHLENSVLYVDSLLENEAERLIDQIRGKQCLLIFDNCTNDIRALNLLVLQKNINIIAFSNDYLFEISKHLIEVEYKRIDICELDQDDINHIYQKIPFNIKKNFNIKRNKSEKFSMIEFMHSVLKNPYSEKSVKVLLERLKEKSKHAFEIFEISIYLCINQSLLSMDALISYTGVYYSKIHKYISDINSLLNSIDESIYQDLGNQDYYSIRSKIFAYYSNICLIKYFKNHYRNVIEKFIYNLNPYSIYRVNLFKKKAFDAEFIYSLFKDGADDLYDHIISIDNGPYSIQQAALYQLRKKEYDKAFALIDEAKCLAPNNFSIKNTYAVILFENNVGIKTVEAFNQCKESMSILSECFNNDKRKKYHAIRYGEFSLKLSSYYKCKDYIEQALSWLKEVETTEGADREIKRLITHLSSI